MPNESATRTYRKKYNAKEYKPYKAFSIFHKFAVKICPEITHETAI